jgi:Rod binding domain-containing protein
MPNEIQGPSSAPAAFQPARMPADPKLWKASQEFQEVFLGQVVKSMRSSEERSDLFEESPGRETFDAMFSEAIGRQMAKSGTLGMQHAIYRQLGGAYRMETNRGIAAGRNEPDQVE